MFKSVLFCCPFFAIPHYDLIPSRLKFWMLHSSYPDNQDKWVRPHVQIRYAVLFCSPFFAIPHYNLIPPRLEFWLHLLVIISLIVCCSTLLVPLQHQHILSAFCNQLWLIAVAVAFLFSLFCSQPRQNLVPPKLHTQHIVSRRKDILWPFKIFLVDTLGVINFKIGVVTLKLSPENTVHKHLVGTLIKEAFKRNRNLIFWNL